MAERGSAICCENRENMTLLFWHVTHTTQQTRKTLTTVLIIDSPFPIGSQKVVICLPSLADYWVQSVVHFPSLCSCPPCSSTIDLYIWRLGPTAYFVLRFVPAIFLLSF
jgi:hypothetical protein